MNRIKLSVPGKKVLFLGGSGLLGQTFQRYAPSLLYPSSKECNIENYSQLKDYIQSYNINVVVHAAAFTSPPKVERDPLRALETNIVGTAHVVRVCMETKSKLVYISTDYVFPGEQGLNKEEDPVFPVNKYAWSKLGGECAVRLYDNHLIIRTSFGPDIFPYDKAFVDQWTSREPVSRIARKTINLLGRDVRGTIHIGGKRCTVYDYAQALDPTRPIGKLSIRDVRFAVPHDTSLDTQRYATLFDDETGMN